MNALVMSERYFLCKGNERKLAEEMQLFGEFTKQSGFVA